MRPPSKTGPQSLHMGALRRGTAAGRNRKGRSYAARPRPRRASKTVRRTLAKWARTWRSASEGVRPAAKGHPQRRWRGSAGCTAGREAASSGCGQLQAWWSQLGTTAVRHQEHQASGPELSPLSLSICSYAASLTAPPTMALRLCVSASARPNRLCARAPPLAVWDVPDGCGVSPRACDALIVMPPPPAFTQQVLVQLVPLFVRPPRAPDNRSVHTHVPPGPRPNALPVQGFQSNKSSTAVCHEPGLLARRQPVIPAATSFRKLLKAE